MSKRLTSHNVEQAARAFASFELARRGYVVQPTDSRFPTEDLLVVSPNGKHFGIGKWGSGRSNILRYYIKRKNFASNKALNVHF